MFKRICLLFIILISLAVSDTEISGEYYGTLTKDNSPYYIPDTLTVPAGKRLTIEPGVTVKFRPDTREREGAIMFIFGDLKASGTVDDSIYFTKSEGSGYWQSVLIREDAENPGTVTGRFPSTLNVFFTTIAASRVPGALFCCAKV